MSFIKKNIYICIEFKISKNMLNKDIILMVGLPGSGKSTYVEKYEKTGYTILSMDKNTMTSSFDTHSINLQIKKGNNKIVIDNTNITKDIRKIFINYAMSNNLTIGIHWINTSKEDCLINSLHRMYKNYGQIFMHISDIKNANVKQEPNSFVLSAIFNMSKTFEKPTNDECDIEITKFNRIDDWNYTNKAIFIDLDGTVRESVGEQPYPIKKSDIKILTNSENILKEYKKDGYMIIAVTNQSAVSKGILSKNDVIDLINETNNMLGDVIDDYYYCPHLPPKETCYCRKPQSGMGIYMMHKYKLNLNSCIMVGDSTSDKTFANRLNMNFYSPDIFFKR